jgi:hypothetical protein
MDCSSARNLELYMQYECKHFRQRPHIAPAIPLMFSALMHGPMMFRMKEPEWDPIYEPFMPKKRPFNASSGHLGIRTSDKLLEFTGYAPGHVATALSNFPVFYTTTENFCYFEVEILRLPVQSILSIGLTTEPYPCFQMPGWSPWSIGLQSNNGRVYICDGHSGRSLTFEYLEGGFNVGDIVGVGFIPPEGTVFWTIRRLKAKKTYRLPDAVTGRYRAYHAAIGCLGESGAKVRVNFGTSDFQFNAANMGLNDPLPPLPIKKRHSALHSISGIFRKDSPSVHLPRRITPPPPMEPAAPICSPSPCHLRSSDPVRTRFGQIPTEELPPSYHVSGNSSEESDEWIHNVMA